MSYLTPEQAATLTQLSLATIQRKCRSGEIEATKPAGQWRIEASALEAWLDGCRPTHVFAQSAVVRATVPSSLPWATATGNHQEGI